jgi:hypothetical protein
MDTFDVFFKHLVYHKLHVGADEQSNIVMSINTEINI